MAAMRRRDKVRSTVRRDDQEGNDSEEWRSGTTMDRVRCRRDEERSYGVRLERVGGGEEENRESMCLMKSERRDEPKKARAYGVVHCLAFGRCVTRAYVQEKAFGLQEN